MERLTFDGNFCDIAQCRELPCPHGGSCTQRKVWERLKAYEDLGLEPEEYKRALSVDIMVRVAAGALGVAAERLRELAEADKAGRLVVLPCKVADTVYRLQYVEESPGRFIVDAMPIKFALIWLNEFGKTVFLTREEAENALEAMKYGN